MSHYPALPLETLEILRSTLSKIDADPAPTCSVLELRRILAERIARLEAIAQHVRDLKTAE